MEWLKTTEGVVAAIVTIVGGLFAGFKFLYKPHEENTLQSKEIEGIRGAITLLGNENKEQIQKLSAENKEQISVITESLRRVVDNQDKILDAVRQNEKEVAVIQKEVEHQGKEIDFMRAAQTNLNERQLQVFDKMLSVFDKLNETLNQRTK